MLAQVTDSGVVIEPNGAIRDYIAWVQGRLIFKRTPLRDVVAELSRAYGVDIHIADSVLARTPIFAEVEVHRQPVAEVLGLIAASMEAHYVRDGHCYVLSSGPSVSKPLDRPLFEKQIPQPEIQYGR